MKRGVTATSLVGDIHTTLVTDGNTDGLAIGGEMMSNLLSANVINSTSKLKTITGNMYKKTLFLYSY